MKVLQESGYTLKVRSQRVSLQPQDPEFYDVTITRRECFSVRKRVKSSPNVSC